VARWLREQGHEVFSVYDEARGLSDDPIIQKACDENWILITNDKDFGASVYREHRSHRGVLFLRLKDERAIKKIEVLRRLIGAYADRLADHFVVASETRVRFAKK
jgi:predicted nuclease of predicted toxin-antitoxin system